MNNTADKMFNFTTKLFYEVRRVSKDGYASLFLLVSISRKKKYYPLKLRWPANCIDIPNQILLPRHRNDKEVNDYNLIINTTKANHTEIQRTYRIKNEELTIEKFTKELKIFDYKESFITYTKKESKSRYIKKDIEKKSYENVHSVLIQVALYDPVSAFKDIDAKWMAGFRNFLLHKEFKEGEKYAPGTIWDRIRTVKTYLNRAATEALIYVNPSAQTFSNPKPKTVTTYLNNEEISRLLVIYDDRMLSKTEYNVLSAFLFTCFTSLRISDVYLIEKKWEQREGILKFMPHKNRKSRKVIEIPIMKLAKRFVQTYSGKFFDLPSAQEYNRTLKDLAQKAEICKNLTSHVGRHTFGYLFMVNVGNIYALQQILGHAKLETTERYAHLDEDYKVEAVKQIEKSFGDFLLR